MCMHVTIFEMNESMTLFYLLNLFDIFNPYKYPSKKKGHRTNTDKNTIRTYCKKITTRQKI